MTSQNGWLKIDKPLSRNDCCIYQKELVVEI